MDKLWAPWRVKYITAVSYKPRGCIFCKMLASTKDRKNLIFTRSRHSFAVLNLFPYNNGHSLILPNRHVSDVSRLRPDELADLWSLMVKTKELLSRVLSPKGYNIGMNIGRVAGAGVPGHVHIHIVPRWRGDVNFMPLTADTKVISQSLFVLYDLLKREQGHKKYRSLRETESS